MALFLPLCWVVGQGKQVGGSPGINTELSNIVVLYFSHPGQRLVGIDKP